MNGWLAFMTEVSRSGTLPEEPAGNLSSNYLNGSRMTAFCLAYACHRILQ